MTAMLSDISPFAVDGVEIKAADGVVFFEGVISMRNPSASVTPLLRKIHLAAVQDGVKILTANLVSLRFMNSSSIRSLVDWVEWIRTEPELNRDVLEFVAKPDVTCQRTTLSANQSLAGDLVTVRSNE